MTQFARPVTKAVVSGINVPHLLVGSIKPESPPAGPKGLPGNVAASTAGRTVCKPKYQGNVLVWRSENCRTGRVLNWMMVPTHVWEICQTQSPSCNTTSTTYIDYDVQLAIERSTYRFEVSFATGQSTYRESCPTESRNYPRIKTSLAEPHRCTSGIRTHARIWYGPPVNMIDLSAILMVDL